MYICTREAKPTCYLASNYLKQFDFVEILNIEIPWQVLTCLSCWSRPRPDYFWRCYPNGVIPASTECDGNPDEIIEGRKSFPSGHSSCKLSFIGRKGVLKNNKSLTRNSIFLINRLHKKFIKVEENLVVSKVGKKSRAISSICLVIGKGDPWWACWTVDQKVLAWTCKFNHSCIVAKKLNSHTTTFPQEGKWLPQNC